MLVEHPAANGLEHRCENTYEKIDPEIGDKIGAKIAVTNCNLNTQIISTPDDKYAIGQFTTPSRQFTTPTRQFTTPMRQFYHLLLRGALRAPPITSS